MDTEPLNQTTREKCSRRSFLYQISENTRQRSIALCQAAATALETEQEIRCMFELTRQKRQSDQVERALYRAALNNERVLTPSCTAVGWRHTPESITPL